jgi:electron transport complex protein RnfD
MIKLKMIGSTHHNPEDAFSPTSKTVIYALLPAMLMALVFFGLKSIVVIATSVISTLFIHWLIQKFILKAQAPFLNGSLTVTAILFAFCLPPGFPVWMIPSGTLILVLFSRLSFDGSNRIPFNPVLLGWLFMRLAFPQQMTTWIGTITATDAFSGATPLGLIHEGVKNGKSILQLTGDVQIPGYFDLFWGNRSGTIGEISTLALLIGGFYLLWKNLISWRIPGTILATIFIAEGVLWAVSPSGFTDPIFQMITGGVMLGAIFLATDPYTTPNSQKGRIIYGAGIGIITLLLRDFGPFPEGIAIAILVMNGFTPLINRKIASQPIS